VPLVSVGVDGVNSSDSARVPLVSVGVDGVKSSDSARVPLSPTASCRCPVAGGVDDDVDDAVVGVDVGVDGGGGGKLEYATPWQK
jgi:hypothetical protein